MHVQACPLEALAMHSHAIEELNSAAQYLLTTCYVEMAAILGNRFKRTFSSLQNAPLNTVSSVDFLKITLKILCVYKYTQHSPWMEVRGQLSGVGHAPSCVGPITLGVVPSPSPLLQPRHRQSKGRGRKLAPIVDLLLQERGQAGVMNSLDLYWVTHTE